PNPVISKVYEGIKIAEAEGVDFILAVGGGSVIDSAKGIAMGAADLDRDVWDYYSDKSEPAKALPVGVVLTLAATGSETSKSSVISNDEGQKRPVNHNIIRPKFAVMNPELTFTLPPYQTACGIVDIMSHALERYMSKNPGGDVTGGMIEALLRAVVKNGRILMDDPENYDARAEVMWAGSLAHSDILGVGRVPDWASHRIEHEITRYTGIAHGAGLAVIMPALMEYVVETDKGPLAQLAEEVWDVPAKPKSEVDTARKGIARMKDFFSFLGMPTRLSEAGIDESLIPKIAGDVQRGASGEVGMYRILSREDVLSILDLAK
ncbi:MAG: iron-containing alcohol dehydrogenase, partial [Spirochaetaceae bacterium]|nr:iron-containing alcohol dehydrogenase [Spirochaetaceae bacterium]